MGWSQSNAGSAFDLGNTFSSDLDSLLGNPQGGSEPNEALAPAAPYTAEAVGNFQSFIQIQRRALVAPVSGPTFATRACWLTADAIVLVLPYAVALQAAISIGVPSPGDEGPIQIQAECVSDWHILFRGGVRQCMRILQMDPRAKAALARFVRTRQQALRQHARIPEDNVGPASGAFDTLIRL